MRTDRDLACESQQQMMMIMTILHNTNKYELISPTTSENGN